MLTTTLAEIRKHGPCEDGFAKIRNHLGVSAAYAADAAAKADLIAVMEG